MSRIPWGHRPGSQLQALQAGNPPKSGPKLFKRYKTTELQQDYLWESTVTLKNSL